MTEAQAQKQAAKSSKTNGAQFVVWIFDEGRDVMDAAQARVYGPLVMVEAAYVSGVRVADPKALLATSTPSLP